MNLDTADLEIEIVSNPTVIYQGDPNSDPIEIRVSASSGISSADVRLYASNSNSIPYEGHEGRWVGLIPTWRFVDMGGKPIETITIPLTYNEELESSVGSASVRYVDDLPCNGAVIFATVETSGLSVESENFADITGNSKIEQPSFANSKVGDTCQIQIEALPPSGIEITRDGFSAFSEEIYWRNMKTPFVASVFAEYPSDFRESDMKKVMVYQYPYSSRTEISPKVSVWAMDGEGEIYRTSADCAPFKLYDNEENMFRIGGYAIGSFIPEAASDSTYISVSAPAGDPSEWSPVRMSVLSDEGMLSMSVPSTIIKDEIYENAVNAMGFSTPSIRSGLVDKLKSPATGSVYGSRSSDIIACDIMRNTWLVDANRVVKLSQTGKILAEASLEWADGLEVSDMCVSANNKLAVALSGSGGCTVAVFNGLSGKIETSARLTGSDALLSPCGKHGVVVSVLNGDCISVWMVDGETTPVGAFAQKGFSPIDTFCCEDVLIMIGKVGDSLSKLTVDLSTKTKKLRVFNPSYSEFSGFSNRGCDIVCASGENGYTVMASDDPVTDRHTAIMRGLNGPCLSVSTSRGCATILTGDSVIRKDSTGETASKLEVSAKPARRGDPNGYKTLNAFRSSKSTSVLQTTTGPFTVDEYKYRTRKFNESWNATAHMRYATGVYPFRENEDFFNKFIESAFGASNTPGEYSLGRKIYEAIANQVQNIHDVDECGIPPLESLAKSQDVPMDDFSMNYPEELDRLMNMFSVSHEKLWGDRCHCDQFYFVDRSKDKTATRMCMMCGHEHGTNLGDPADDMVSIRLSESDHPPYVVDIKHQRGNYLRIIPSIESINQSKAIIAYLRKLLREKCGDNPSLEEIETAISSETDPWVKGELTMMYSLVLLTHKEEALAYYLENLDIDSLITFSDIIKVIEKCGLDIDVAGKTIQRLKDEITSKRPERVSELLDIADHKQLVAIHTNQFTSQPWTNYCFYQYLDRECHHTSTGIINWDDRNTQLKESDRSIPQWLDKNGIMERVFSYVLHKNLGFT